MVKTLTIGVRRDVGLLMHGLAFQLPFRVLLVSALGVGALTRGSLGQTDPPDFGFDWVTVGTTDNIGYNGEDPQGWLTGRGSVPYEYRIGRTEVTTAQWMAFVNTFSTQSDELAGFGAPNHWGAVHDTSYQGPGLRWTLPPGDPDAGMQPVFGISWRTCARYCNWLHNGGGPDLSTLEDGAYDTSTFTQNPDFTYNDQRTHHPDARYWIPTWDEWLKAAHYDPDRFGSGQEGWWLYSHRSDGAPIPGPPGEGETSASFRFENDPFAHLDIPLGAYPETLSPWGLLDITGGTQEWTEEVLKEVFQQFRQRIVDGAGADSFDTNLDLAWHFGTTFPVARGPGLRIVSAIPTPSSVITMCVPVVWLSLIRRRRT